MPARQTQVITSARRTEYATVGMIDPADKLYGVVKAFNVRKAGRQYAGDTESLFEAVKAFNTRRLG